MSRSRFNEPLAKAAADSLRKAAKLAREQAAATGVPLVTWKNGRVVHVPVEKTTIKTARRAAAKSTAR